MRDSAQNSKEKAMKGESIIAGKSFAFALKAVGVGKMLMQEKKEYTLSKQFIRSATSIGANVAEASGGQSRADFYAKLTIAYKEARETAYWIRLLGASGYLAKGFSDELLADVDELLRILGSIQVAMKNDPRPNIRSTRNS